MVQFLLLNIVKHFVVSGKSITFALSKEKKQTIMVKKKINSNGYVYIDHMGSG